MQVSCQEASLCTDELRFGPLEQKKNVINHFIYYRVKNGTLVINLIPIINHSHTVANHVWLVTAHETNLHEGVLPEESCEVALA